MTSTDIFKLVLAVYGFSEISVTSEKFSENKYYFINASNPYKNIDFSCDGYGIMDTLWNILSTLKDMGIETDMIFSGLSVKSVLDDKTRKEIVDKKIEADKKNKEWMDKNREKLDIISKTNPCENCEKCDNESPVSMWKCSKQYYMNCEHLRKWHKLYDEMLRTEDDNKVKEISKQLNENLLK